MIDCDFQPRACGGVVCVRCGAVRHRPTRRNCIPPRKPQARPELTTLGKLLIAVAPGSAAAWLIKCSGAKLAAEWTQLIEQDCPACMSREAWLNRAWEQFVWRHFSRVEGSD